MHQGSHSAVAPLLRASCLLSPSDFLLVQRLNMFGIHTLRNWIPARYMSNASIELETDCDVVRFSIGKQVHKDGSRTKGKKTKRVKMSKKAKLNELRFYRLKAKKKMTSPNPEVRISYKLEKVGYFPLCYLLFNIPAFFLNDTPLFPLS